MGRADSFDGRQDVIQGAVSSSPIPTQVVSNEEFTPHPQTAAQARVEHILMDDADHAAASLGLTRRDFLRGSGGMAVALLAMNSVYGKFFDVLGVEAVETAAFAERTGGPYFIFDVQTHYVGEPLRS